MPDPGVSRAASTSLASLSRHYDAVTAAAKVAELGNDLFRISTDRVVISNNAAVASLTSLSSHYTAVAAAAKAAHLKNNLFRIGTDQVVDSNATAATNLAALASGFAAVAAAAAATAEAVEAARAAFAAPSPASGATGGSGSSNPWWVDMLWGIAGGLGGVAAGTFTMNPAIAIAVSSAITGAGIRYGGQAEQWIIDLFTSDNQSPPPSLQKELDKAVSGSGYGLGLGMPSPYHGLDVGYGIHVEVTLDKKTLAETFVTRDELAEARRNTRAAVGPTRRP